MLSEGVLVPAGMERGPVSETTWAVDTEGVQRRL